MKLRQLPATKKVTQSREDSRGRLLEYHTIRTTRDRRGMTTLEIKVTYNYRQKSLRRPV